MIRHHVLRKRWTYLVEHIFKKFMTAIFVFVSFCASFFDTFFVWFSFGFVSFFSCFLFQSSWHFLFLFRFGVCGSSGDSSIKRSSPSVTADGIEMTMMTDHRAEFCLTSFVTFSNVIDGVDS